MRKIAVVNFKGGTGKTTTVINLGAGLAEQGKRVLLVDIDAQGSLALALGLKYSHSLAEAITKTAPIEECIVHGRTNLYVIPSDNSLMLAQKEVSSYVNWQDALARVLQSIEDNYDFDFFLIDCAASITLLNINALNYATEIFIPTQVEYLSLAGLNQVLENLARVRFPNRPRKEVIDLGISLIIPTMYDIRMRQSRRLLQDLRETYGRHVAHPIRINVRLSEAPSHHKTIFEYAPKSRGASDYSRLVDLVLQESLLIGEDPIGLQKQFEPTPAELPLTLGDDEYLELEEEQPATITIPHPEVSAARQAERVVSSTASSEHALASFSSLPDQAPAVSTRPECPYCNVSLSSLSVAGYRVFHCERCGYQRQVLLRDLQDH